MLEIKRGSKESSDTFGVQITIVLVSACLKLSKTQLMPDTFGVQLTIVLVSACLKLSKTQLMPDTFGVQLTIVDVILIFPHSFLKVLDLLLHLRAQFSLHLLKHLCNKTTLAYVNKFYNQSTSCEI